jgi:hypothetical protein
MRGQSEDYDELIIEAADCPDVDTAWERAFRTYEGCDSRLPLYSRDANAAVHLPLAPFSRLDVLVGIGYVSAAVTGHERFVANNVEEIAHVMTQAWLSWRELYE